MSHIRTALPNMPHVSSCSSNLLIWPKTTMDSCNSIWNPWQAAHQRTCPLLPTNSRTYTPHSTTLTSILFAILLISSGSSIHFTFVSWGYGGKTQTCVCFCPQTERPVKRLTRTCWFDGCTMDPISVWSQIKITGHLSYKHVLASHSLRLFVTKELREPSVICCCSSAVSMRSHWWHGAPRWASWFTDWIHSINLYVKDYRVSEKRFKEHLNTCNIIENKNEQYVCSHTSQCRLNWGPLLVQMVISVNAHLTGSIQHRVWKRSQYTMWCHTVSDGSLRSPQSVRLKYFGLSPTPDTRSGVSS